MRKVKLLSSDGSKCYGTAELVSTSPGEPELLLWNDKIFSAVHRHYSKEESYIERGDVEKLLYIDVTP